MSSGNLRGDLVALLLIITPCPLPNPVKSQQPTTIYIYLKMKNILMIWILLANQEQDRNYYNIDLCRYNYFYPYNH